jgi:hypothetical protein
VTGWFRGHLEIEARNGKIAVILAFPSNIMDGTTMKTVLRRHYLA